MKQKVTPWYPGTMKPVHIGPYERRYSGHSLTYKCTWTGIEWFFMGRRSIYQALQWRGIMKGKK